MKVKHFMVPCDKVVQINQDSSIKAAAEKMINAHVGSIIITDNERHPVGIVTAKDFVKAAYTLGKSGETSVKEIMTPKLITVDEEAERDEVAEILLKNKIHHVIVTRDKNLWVGLSTAFDVSKEAALDAKAFPYSRSAWK